MLKGVNVMTFQVLCVGCGRWYRFEANRNNHHCDAAIEKRIERGRKANDNRMLYEYRTFADRLAEAEAMLNAVEA